MCCYELLVCVVTCNRSTLSRIVTSIGKLDFYSLYNTPHIILMGNINTQPLRRGLFNTLMNGALGIENWYNKLGVVCCFGLRVPCRVRNLSDFHQSDS